MILRLTRNLSIAWLLVTACSFDPSTRSSGVGLDDGGSVDGAVADDGGLVLQVDASAADPRKSITVMPGRATEDLVNFPLHVTLREDSDLQDGASQDGSDIFFEASNGAALDYEIESWDPSNGSLTAWVRVPSITALEGVVIYLRYGNAAIASPPNPTSVWSEGFLSVWHLGDDPAGGATDSIRDSLGLRHGTAHTSMDAADVVAGALGKGLHFDGGDDVVLFDNPLLGSSSHTISAWVNQETTTNNDALVVLGNGSCNESRWFHSRFNGGSVATGFYCDDWTTSNDIQNDGWKLLHWTYSSESGISNMYIGGALVDGPFTHAGNQDTQGAGGRIGNATGAFGGDMGINGVVDEVRISSAIRSAGWMAAEFANQTTPQNFYVLGAEEP